MGAESIGDQHVILYEFNLCGHYTYREHFKY